MTEEMIAYVCDSVFGTRKLTYDGVELDFNPPWQRVNLRQSLIEKANIDISLYPTAEALEEMMVSLHEGQTRGSSGQAYRTAAGRICRAHPGAADLYD